MKKKRSDGKTQTSRKPQVFQFKYVRNSEICKIEFSGKRDRFDENDMFYEIDIKFYFSENIFFPNISQTIKSFSIIKSSSVFYKQKN